MTGVMKMKFATQSLVTALACCCVALSAQAQESGVKVSIMVHDDGSRTVKQTDPEQHTSEETTYSLKDKLLKRIVFTLDENNVAISGVIFAPNGKPVRKMVFKNDPLNRLSEEQDYTMDGQYLGKFVYEYNAKGKLVKIHGFDANGTEVNASPSRPDKKNSGNH